MIISENRRVFTATGAIWLTAGMALVSCSKGDTVTNSNPDGGVQVSTCGNLDAATAAQLFATRLENLGSVGLGALAGLENSRAAARLLTFGNENIIDPFVSDDQSSLHDSLTQLRDEQLIAANVESSDAPSVTFLLSAETQCKNTAPVTAPIAIGAGGAGSLGGAGSTGGSTASNVDPACVSEKQAHPTRIRISRVACDQGDNIAVELISGTTRERVITANLFADHAEVQLDLGAMLRESYSTTYSTPPANGGTSVPQRTENPVVTSATGVLQGTLTLTGSSQANANVSIAQAIDITFADDSAARIQLGAATNVLTASGDGAAKTIQVTTNAGAFDWRSKFEYFINDFFGLQTNTTASAAAPVDIHVAGLSASVNLDGNRDTVSATGFDIGGAPATAKQGDTVLLSVDALSAAQNAIVASITGNANDTLGMSLTNGLNVNIHYGLQPVISMVDNPADYLASDTLTFDAPAGSDLTLAREASTNELTVVTTTPTGTLLRINAGSLGISSAVWPADNVSVAAGQCLTRTLVSQSGHNDLLDDFSLATCTQ